MSKTTFARAAMTGRLADNIGAEVALSLIAIAVVTGVSLWKLDGVWRFVLPAAAVVYSATRIILVARRNRRSESQHA
ncbi:MAG: hypothetical protein ACRD0P_15490 [Stackebrandtia sp.]